MQCGTCGVWHAFPETIYEHCYREGGFWSCPNGHRRGWDKGAEKKEVDLLRQERDRLKQRQAMLEDDIAAARRLTAAAKAETTKLRKRVGAGVCPCCNRTFQNVARHMATKHSNVVPIAS
jgi:hypothetical protein